MIPRPFALAVFSLLSTLVTAAAQDAPQAVLERYSLGVGQNADGVSAGLVDQFFGGGNTRAAVAFFDTVPRFGPNHKAGVLTINVSRAVPRDTIAFALLCFGVQVRGFNEAGETLYSKDLQGFTFGDSRGGRYSQVLRRIPLGVTRLEVTFIGNYE
jgi:hypothetical protein